MASSPQPSPPVEDREKTTKFLMMKLDSMAMVLPDGARP
jgi:hypothetical protein